MYFIYVLHDEHIQDVLFAEYYDQEDVLFETLDQCNIHFHSRGSFKAETLQKKKLIQKWMKLFQELRGKCITQMFPAKPSSPLKSKYVYVIHFTNI